MLPDVSFVVFDFGQVLLEVFFERAELEFAKLQTVGGQSREMSFSRDHQSEIFTKLEIGDIGPAEFRKSLREQFSLSASDVEIDAAWNSILGDMFQGRVELLRSLQAHYRLALLSNTNIIHYKHWLPGCRELLALFDHVLLSFEMGCRKPEPDIYRKCLEALDIDAGQVLFIDDSPANVQAAEKLGIHSLLLNEPDALDHVCQLLLQAKQTHPSNPD